MRTSREETARRVRASLPSRFRLRPDQGADGSASAVDGLMRSLRPVLRNVPIPAEHWAASGTSVTKLLDAAAPGSFQGTRPEDTQTFTVDRDSTVVKLMCEGWALPHLLLLAALTFPHATTSRYPAPIGAPDNPWDAAKCGKMGAQHYTRTLGIVDQIRELNEQTTIVLEDLRPFLRGTHMLREAVVETDE